VSSGVVEVRKNRALGDITGTGLSGTTTETFGTSSAALTSGITVRTGGSNLTTASQSGWKYTRTDDERDLSDRYGTTAYSIMATNPSAPMTITLPADSSVNSISFALGAKNSTKNATVTYDNASTALLSLPLTVWPACTQPTCQSADYLNISFTAATGRTISSITFPSDTEDIYFIDNFTFTSQSTSAATTIESGAAVHLVGSGLEVPEPFTITGAGSGSGAILNVANDNRLTGNITLAGDATLGSTANTLTFDAASGNAFGASSGTPAITFVGDGSHTVVDPMVSPISTLTKSGTGTLELQGANTYTGITTINSSGGKLLVTGTLGASATYSVGISIGASSTFEYAATSGTQTLSGVISGEGVVNKLGESTLKLSGASNNTYTGATTVSAGVLRVAKSVALGSTAGITTVSGTGAVHFDGSSLSVAEPFTIAASGSGTGALLNLANSNTVTGAVTLSAAATIGSTSGTLTFNVSSGNAFDASTGTPAITFAGAGNVTVSDPVDEPISTLTKSGTGTLALSAVNTYTGSTTLSDSGGTLLINTSGQLGSGNYSQAIALGSGTTLDFASSAAQTFAGAISGSGDLKKTIGTTNTLTLSQANTGYTGATTVNAGTLEITNSQALGDATATTVASGATLTIATTGDVGEALNISGTGVSSAGAVHFTAGAKVTGTVTLSADSTVQVADSITTAEISGKVSGSAGVTKGGTGTGTLILSGDNDYTGATNIDVGTLSVGRTGGSVPDRSAMTLSGTATFNLANNNETVGSIASSATGTTITLGSGTLSSGDDKASGSDTSTTFAGVISGATGQFTKQGSGTLTLSGINTYGGTTTLSDSGGTLLIGGAGQLGGGSYLGAISLGSGATLEYA